MKLKNLIKKGFTLIELLVVIAIIGIILAYASANYLTAQKQARDTRRQQDLEAVQNAMETYYTLNGAYPVDVQIDTAFDTGTRPVDPKPATSTPYTWKTDSDSYCICSTMETKAGNANGSTSDACSWTSTGQFFCVANRQ
jgi:prepilin-type N-terminal cleavage/methylation domain-containing protein